MPALYVIIKPKCTQSNVASASIVSAMHSRLKLSRKLLFKSNYFTEPTPEAHSFKVTKNSKRKTCPRPQIRLKIITTSFACCALMWKNDKIDC